MRTKPKVGVKIRLIRRFRELCMVIMIYFLGDLDLNSYVIKITSYEMLLIFWYKCANKSPRSDYYLFAFFQQILYYKQVPR